MIATQKRARQQAGFSLMEAIVAVAILGVASVPLLALQSQNARSVMRLEERAIRIAAEQVTADYLSVLDVSASRAGELMIGGGWQVSWQAVPASEAIASVIGIGQPGRYAAQLIRIDAIVRHEGGAQFETQMFRTAVQETFPYSPF